MDQRLPDWLRGSSITVTADMLQRRWAGLESLLPLIAEDEIIRSLSCMARRGVPISDESAATRIIDCFFEADPTFPRDLGNHQLQALAAGALILALEDESHKRRVTVISLAQLTIGAGQLPVAEGVELQAACEQRLMSRIAELRQGGSGKLASSPLTKIELDSENLAEQTAGGNPAAAWKSMVDAVHTLATNVVKVRSLISQLVRRDSFRQEETDILWWLMAGWSRDLGRPFEKLPAAALPPVVGKELADRVLQLPGPMAAEAFLHRALRNADSDALDKKRTFAEYVNALDENWRERLSSQLSDVGPWAMFLPLHAAMEECQRIGGKASGWHEAFSMRTGMKPKRQIGPEAIALQLYRERLLMRAVADEQ